MSFTIAQATNTAASSVPYLQATSSQRRLALEQLRQQLRLHFPTLSRPPWREALDLLQPDLYVLDGRVSLAYQDVEQLVQHLATSPELPQLDPPLYGPQALYLAQQRVDLDELAIRVLPELAAAPNQCGPYLFKLVSQLARGNAVAQQIVQAVRWGLAVGRPLRPGLPGSGPAPGSPEVEQQLQWLAQACGYAASNL